MTTNIEPSMRMRLQVHHHVSGLWPNAKVGSSDTSIVVRALNSPAPQSKSPPLSRLRLLLLKTEPLLLALLLDLFGRALLRAPLLRPEPSRQRDEDGDGPHDRAPRREDRGDEQRRHGERRQ